MLSDTKVMRISFPYSITHKNNISNIISKTGSNAFIIGQRQWTCFREFASANRWSSCWFIALSIDKFSWYWIDFNITAQKMKFFIKDFFSKADQIRSFLRIWSNLLKKSLMENLIFCAVFWWALITRIFVKFYKIARNLLDMMNCQGNRDWNWILHIDNCYFSLV